MPWSSTEIMVGIAGSAAWVDAVVEV